MATRADSAGRGRWPRMRSSVGMGRQGGWITQGPAGWGKDSGLFSMVDLKHSAECPRGRTRFHPE